METTCIPKDKAKHIRQAVVVIHGMGEQRPNDTLNAFVELAIGNTQTPSDQDPIIFSRPDKVSNKYDSRRIQLRETDQNNQTEFYEYHWAHLMEGNKVAHLWPLVKLVMLKPFWCLPLRLLPFWFMFWLLIMSSLYGAYIMWQTGAELNLPNLLGAIGLSGIAVALIPQAFKAINYFGTSYLADVARYVDSRPTNQKVRDKIRSELVELLCGLHQSGRYSRVIVVAHSLGSFIAYDAISYLWARINKLHATATPTESPKYEQLKKLEQLGGMLSECEEECQKAKANFQITKHKTKEPREKYRAQQREAWVEKRLSGNPWLITDFLTFGSPLAHAQTLLATDRASLRRKQDKFELSRCPPSREPFANNQWNGDTWYSWENSKGHRVLYHAAPFALVRWSNFWFPTDWFAGPLAPNFGYGIEDHELKSDPAATKIPLLSHTQYFSHGANDKTLPFVETIRNTLNLNANSWLPDTLGSPQPDPITQDDTGRK
jgi:pimeloyl-ACP methyl ester carboxylesterase